MRHPRAARPRWSGTIAAALLVLILSCAARAEGMFDLPQGTYFTRDRKPTLTLRIGDAKTHALRFESSGAWVSGTYRVTATKMGDYHATFTVQAVHGNARSVLGLAAKPADEVRVNFNFGGMDNDAVMVTVFDADIQPVMSRTLFPKKKA